MTTEQKISNLFEIKESLGKDHTRDVMLAIIKHDPQYILCDKKKEMMDEIFKYSFELNSPQFEELKRFCKARSK